MTFSRQILRCTLLGLIACGAASGASAVATITATRVGDSPIIVPEMLSGDDGASINGPSIIRVPSWVKNPLGKYYLYFAHHAGKYIRFAYADQMEGPWHILRGGVQQLKDQTALSGHVASPDAVVDEQTRSIFLFFHGKNPLKPPGEKKGDPESEAGQASSVSVSTDGIHFKALNLQVGPAYLQLFSHKGQWFGINHTGILRQCDHLGTVFKPVAKIIGDDIAESIDPARLGEPGATPAADRPKDGALRYSIRHVGTDVVGDTLYIYFTCVGHRPERVFYTTVDMTGPPEGWRAKGATEVLRPERDWEGANMPLAYSNGGISRMRVREVRDPAVFRDGDAAWLIYTVAGEHGLGLARLQYPPAP